MKHLSLLPLAAIFAFSRIGVIRSHTPRRAIIGLSAAWALTVGTAHAQTLFWDGTDTTANADGGNGTWDTTTSNWDDAATGGANATWNNATPNSADFAGAAGTVTLGTNISVNNLDFNTDGYTIDLGGNTLTNSVNGTFISSSGGADVTFQNGTVSLSQTDGVANMNPGSGSLITFASNALVTGSNGIQMDVGGGSGTRVVLNNVNNDFTGNLRTTFSATFEIASIADSGVASAAGKGNEILLGNNGQLIYTGSSGASTNRTLTLFRGGTTPINNQSGGNLTWTGAVNSSQNTSKTLNLTGNAGSRTEIQGVLADNGANLLSFSVSGGGSPGPVGILSGVNTFTGNISVNNQAKLIIDGAGQLGSGNYAGNITLNQAGDFEYSSTADQILGGIISDDSPEGQRNDLTKGEDSTLTLSGNNNYTGKTFINNGILSAQNANALGTTADNTTVADGATLNVSGGISIAENINISGLGHSSTGAINSDGNNTLTGLITLNASSTIQSDTGGILSINGGVSPSSGSRNLTLSGATDINSAINLGPGGDIFFQGVSGGAATHTVDGSAHDWRNAYLNFSGTAQIEAADALPTDSGLIFGWNGTDSFQDSGTLDLNGNNLTVASLETRSAAIGSAGTRNITGGATLTVNQTTITEFDGVIEGATTLVKSGNGTLTLSGTNTYTGATTVSSGTLLVNGSLTNEGGLTVASGATLGGSGIIGGLTTINGIHAPGNSPGIENFTDLTYSGATIQWELIGNTTSGPGTNFDRIMVGNNLDFAGATTLELDFSTIPGDGGSVDWTNGFWALHNIREWQIWGVTGTTSFTGLTGGLSDISITFADSGNDSNGIAYNPGTNVPDPANFYLFQSGQSIYLRYEALPEPATFGLLGLLMGMLTLFTRPRRKIALES